MLNFTRQERYVVYFLVVTLGIGAIIKLVKDQQSDAGLVPTRFYEEETRFKEISEQINSREASLVDSSNDGVEQGDAESPIPSANQKEKTSLINLNTANAGTLTELPGIGPALAKRIRAYTDQNGPFKNKTDIVLVKGIGKKLYAQIKGLVTTE